ncbi:histidine phosphatase family protein [Tateyamaria sp. SN6-1]|uniref:histidine phosphatase family protein n=1 Tax=Tateyamaria sp. SN6-1 TaxID=3092148 RepID=UPI0039F554BD
MSHITLIRHGQANTHATDEASYDQLSALGRQQSAWLGDHMRATHQHHTRLYTGTLKRHRQTAQAMNTGLTPVEDARLNELEYFTMAQALEDEHGISAPADPSQFVHHFPVVLTHWRDDKLEGAPERFSEFEARIRDAIAEIGAGTGPALVVTSGGLIANTMRQHLDLDIAAMARVGLAIFNTSMHRLHPIGGTWSPVLFNAIPHLDAPDRHHAQTHV